MTAFVSLLFAFMLSPATVHACSLGPGPTFKEQLATVNMVRGRIVESDVARQNFVLQIESYLTREAGPEFVILTMTDPMTIQGLLDTKLGGGDCNWLLDPLPEFEAGYFSLGDLHPSGTYRYGLYGLFISEQYFPLDIHDEAGNVEATYDQAQFEQYLLDLHGRSAPSKPLPGSRYPSTAPLLITTQAGDEYILPVSQMEPVLVDDTLFSFSLPIWVDLDYYEATHCTRWECVILSEDGRTLIVKLEDEFVYRQQYRSFHFTAESLLLSPIGLATWNAETITIYAIHDVMRYASDRIDLPRQIAQTILDPSPLTSAEHSVWSADGRLLAFSDAVGLWVWDVFTPDASPTLLVSAEETVPVATAFSGLGRYLSVQQGDKRFILDLLTHNRLPFGYLSPDEMLMLRCEPESTSADTSGEGLCRLQLEQLAPNSSIAVWGMLVEDDIKVRWVHDRRVLVQVCATELEVCGIIDSNAYAHRGNSYDIRMTGQPYNFKPALDFAVQGRNIAILRDESTIEVNGTPITLEASSPIAELRWLPSVFYGESTYPPRILN